MARDAFMILAPMDLLGESYDYDFGERSASFEISSVDFDLNGTMSKPATVTVPGSSASTKSHQRDGSSKPQKVTVKTPNASSGDDEEDRTGKVTITKFIESCSPKLFRYCCEYNHWKADEKTNADRGLIKWAIITIRRTGSPWLIMEFQHLHVIDFNWDIDPSGGGDDFSKMEKVKFNFQSIKIRYSAQLPSGEMAAEAFDQWNFANQNAVVDPLPSVDWLPEELQT